VQPEKVYDPVLASLKYAGSLAPGINKNHSFVQARIYCEF
jgi:hypothetical protein